MKIENITINKYKAFLKEEKIPIGKKNVFIYGENGSGKSSFYYALKDFFQSSVENVDMASLRNFSLNDGLHDCSIMVEFDNAQINILNESTKNTRTTAITDANRLKSFLTYKHLLGIHNVKISEKIDIFDLVITGVLKHFKSQSITGDAELGKLWYDTESESKKKLGKDGDFYHSRHKKKAVETKAEAFNQAINKLFLASSSDYLGLVVNRVLKRLFPELVINFVRQLVIVEGDGRLRKKPALFLEVELNGNSIDSRHPHFSLNEAKLSAIAISIFLGAIIKQSPFSLDIKPLFLDDILIGLDNENRLKLLDLLQEKDVPAADKVFKDFQIFITTYDRHWYEVAKMNLQGWGFLEFYKSPSGPQIIHNSQTALQKARSYFEAFDFPACANYLRKECERVLIDKLLKTYTVGDGIKGLVDPPKLATLIDRLGDYYEDLGLEPPDDLIKSLQNYKSILFNPMSHSDLESPIYRNDLDLAFKTIAELDAIVLPSRNLLLTKGSLLNIAIPSIQYIAIVELAKDVYVVANAGTKSISPLSFFFKTWTREGVVHAAPKGSPPTPVSDLERLEKIKDSPFSVAAAVIGLNHTCLDRGQAVLSEEDFLRSMTTSSEILFDVLDNAKK